MAVVKTRRQVQRPASRRKVRAKVNAKTLSSKGTAKAKQKVRPLRRAKSFGKMPTPVAKAYVEALRRSRQTGQTVGFVVNIRPDGAEKVSPIEEGSGTMADQRQPAAGNPELHRALAAARDRGQLRVAEILAGPEMLSADAFAERLGTTRATVTAWRHKNQVLGLEGATRGFRFPEWQVGDDGKPFGVLPKLFDRLGGDAWVIYRFLVQHHPELGSTTAKEALRQGRADEVVEAAESVARAFA
jgi:DNA-binding transcriptional regulator YiaG